MQDLVSVVIANGGDMPFPAFVIAARAAGASPEFWLKAKHAGLLATRIIPAVSDANGNVLAPSVLMISAVV